MSSISVPATAVIRPAKEGDLELLRAWNSAVDRVVEPTLHRQEAGEAQVLLALIEPWPVGHLLVDFTARQGAGAALLWHMCVSNTLRNRGIGSRLIAAAEQAAAAMGLLASELEVEKDNPDAERLYRRLGYAVVGEHDEVWPEPDELGQLRDVSHPCWGMRKDLSSSPGLPTTGWMIDEVGHAGPEHVDPGYVAGYDRKAQFDPEPDIELFSSLGLDSQSTVIDFGAGTGTFAIAAAARCSQVIAVEPSAAMAEALRAKAIAVGAANVVPVRAGFLSYEHSGPPADFAYSRNALHHLPDFWKVLALTRIAGALKPRGVLLLRDLVYSFEVPNAGPALEAWIRSGAATVADGWTPDELAEHVRLEHSTFSWLLEAMLDRSGFEIVEATFTESKVFAAYVCRKRGRSE